MGDVKDLLFDRKIEGIIETIKKFVWLNNFELAARKRRRRVIYAYNYIYL